MLAGGPTPTPRRSRFAPTGHAVSAGSLRGVDGRVTVGAVVLPNPVIAAQETVNDRGHLVIDDAEQLS